jgi:predicted glutamine amidotransferase
MCQLLGISSSSPTSNRTAVLLRPFYDRGGATDCHSHGWGLALLRKDGVWDIYNETSAAATSLKAKEMISNAQQQLVSTNMISHIRYATMGEVCLENVHPFRRTLFGLEFVFAHNGDVDVSQLKDTQQSWQEGPFQPYGGTDSEFCFCLILNYIHHQFTYLPTLEELYVAIEEICLDICTQQEGTILNFLLGFGEVLFGFSWPGKRPGSHVWNSLHYTLQQDGNAQAAIITTKPLTEAAEEWIEFQKGDLLLFVNGRLIASDYICNMTHDGICSERRPSI